MARSSLPPLAAATTSAVLQAFAPYELRLTSNRRALLAVLEAAERPLTADEIVERSGVALSTVYRNLGEMVDVGVVARVAMDGGGDRYELAEQLSLHHHHHLVCTECGIVTDFSPSADLERRIADEVVHLLDHEGFEVTSHVFDVRGRCRRCRAHGDRRSV